MLWVFTDSKDDVSLNSKDVQAESKGSSVSFVIFNLAFLFVRRFIYIFAYCFGLLLTVKDKAVSAPGDVETPDEMEEDNKKRHLNVVFIGHVGRLIYYMILPSESHLYIYLFFPLIP